MEKNIIKICFPLMLALTASNCTKDFPALNVNPNQLINVPYKALLTNSINSISRAYYTNIYCDNWTRYRARTIYAQNDQYSLDGSLTNFDAYSGHLKDLKLAMQKAQAVNDLNTVAVTKILTASPKARRICCAPCQSISKTTSIPACSRSVICAAEVP